MVLKEQKGGPHKTSYREVLVIDDNPRTRKVVRLSLESDVNFSEKLKVLEAGSAEECMRVLQEHSPILFLIDLRLPDCRGQDLLSLLRKLPQFVNVPMIAFTGFVSEGDMKSSLLGFDGYIIKPVLPSQLVKIVQGYVNRLKDGQRKVVGSKLLIVDDDPIQLKLEQVFFKASGFDVVTANDGKEALEIFRNSKFDIVISDVLMPHIDGFKLCTEIRNGKTHSNVPIVLVTNHFVNEDDMRFSKDIGADDYVIRSPDLFNLSKSVFSLLGHKHTAQHSKSDLLIEPDYVHRIIQQLERQTSVNTSRNLNISLFSLTVKVLSDISNAICKESNVEQMMPAVLAHCFDVAGLSIGAFFLKDKYGKITSRYCIGIDNIILERVENLFTKMGFFNDGLDFDTTLAFSLDPIYGYDVKNLLQILEAKYMLVSPLRSFNDQFGIFILAGHSEELTQENWKSFASAIANQVSQSLALLGAINKLKFSDDRYNALMDLTDDGVFFLNPDGSIFGTNPGALKLLDSLDEEVLGKNFRDFCTTEQADYIEQEFQTINTQGKTLSKNVIIKRKNGNSEVDLSGLLVNHGENKVIVMLAHLSKTNVRIEPQLDEPLTLS